MALSADEAPSERTDEAGVAAGITVLVMATPLLLLSALSFYSGRLAQADNHLSWAATSAARAGAHCRIPVSDAENSAAGNTAGNTAVSQAATGRASRACTLREAALTIEKTARAILLENRRLYCLNSGSTGMRVEYQDQDGDLIYAYVIGSLLLNSRYWPDRGGAIPEPGDFDADAENPQDSPNFDPFQSRNLRRDMNGEVLFVESSEGVASLRRRTFTPPGIPGDPTPPEPVLLEIIPDRKSNPSAFENSMENPLGPNASESLSSTPVGRITVQMICDFAGAATNLMARASTREASATAVVPIIFPSEAV